MSESTSFDSMDDVAVRDHGATTDELSCSSSGDSSLGARDTVSRGAARPINQEPPVTGLHTPNEALASTRPVPTMSPVSGVLFPAADGACDGTEGTNGTRNVDTVAAPAGVPATLARDAPDVVTDDDLDSLGIMSSVGSVEDGNDLSVALDGMDDLMSDLSATLNGLDDDDDTAHTSTRPLPVVHTPPPRGSASPPRAQTPSPRGTAPHGTPARPDSPTEADLPALPVRMTPLPTDSKQQIREKQVLLRLEYDALQHELRVLQDTSRIHHDNLKLSLIERNRLQADLQCVEFERDRLRDARDLAVREAHAKDREIAALVDDVTAMHRAEHDTRLRIQTLVEQNAALEGYTAEQRQRIASLEQQLQSARHSHLGQGQGQGQGQGPADGADADAGALADELGVLRSRHMALEEAHVALQRERDAGQLERALRVARADTARLESFCRVLSEEKDLLETQCLRAESRATRLASQLEALETRTAAERTSASHREQAYADSVNATIDQLTAAHTSEIARLNAEHGEVVATLQEAVSEAQQAQQRQSTQGASQDRHRDEIETLTAQLEALQDEAMAHEQTVAEQQNRLALLDAQLPVLSAQLKEALRAAEDAETRATASEARAQTLASDLRLATAGTTAETQLENAERECARLAAERDALLESQAQLTQSLAETRRAHHRERHEEMASLRALNVGLTADLERLTAYAATCKAERAAAEQESAAAAARVVELSHQLDASQTQAAAQARQSAAEQQRMAQTVESLRAVVASLEAEAGAQRGRVAELSGVAASLRASGAASEEQSAQLRALRDENAQLRAREAEVRASVAHIDEDAQALSAQLAAAETDKRRLKAAIEAYVCPVCACRPGDDARAIRTEVGVATELTLRDDAIGPASAVAVALVPRPTAEHPRPTALPCEVRVEGARTAVVVFTPEALGVLEMAVAVDGVPLAASPLTVTVARQKGRVTAAIALHPDVQVCEPCPECRGRGTHAPDCPEFVDNCPQCGDRVLARLIPQHLAEWCRRRHVSCEVCHRTVLAVDYNIHMGRHVAVWEARRVVGTPMPHFGVFICDDYSGGARVTDVRSDQPADQSGITAGDIITTIADVHVASKSDFARAVYTLCQPDEPIRVEYLREGVLYECTCVPEHIGIPMDEYRRLRALQLEWDPAFDPPPDTDVIAAPAAISFQGAL